MAIKKEKIRVFGMTCTSCEGRIEREIKKISGVVNAKANYETESLAVDFEEDVVNLSMLKEGVKKAGYSTKNPNLDKIAGILLIGIAILFLGKFSGNFDMESKLAGDVTYLVLFIVGILTSLHCVGMCGGIMISQSLAVEGKGKLSALKPGILYNLGRVTAYTVLGGIIGGVGSVFNLSLGLKSGIMIFAGIFMVIMGLNMAGFNILRKLHIRLPWSSCALKSRVKSPFVVGLLNGLMPCGPLQTMQIYALGTGSIIKGAASMFFFSIGTVPLMLAFGMITGILSKGYTKRILKLSGILVVVLGVIMSNRGLALSGMNIPSMMSFKGSSKVNQNTAPFKAEVENGVQIIRMSANYSGYVPNVLYVQKGMPVKWIINGEQLTSCNNAINVPSLNIQKKLKQGENVVEFTPGDKDINFSCWMGMIRGVIKVVDDINAVDTSKVPEGGLPASGGGSCCGGGPAGSGTPQGYSIYGDDITKVPTDRLIKRVDAFGEYQSLKIKGVGYEFEPLVIVVNKGVKTRLTIDLLSFEVPEGKYQIINGDTGDVLTSFEGKRGLNNIEFTIKDSSPYGIIKDGSVLGVIEAVDDARKADLEALRSKYFDNSTLR